MRVIVVMTPVVTMLMPALMVVRVVVVVLIRCGVVVWVWMRTG